MWNYSICSYINKKAKMQNELTDRDLPGLTLQAARQAFEALATRCGWDLARAHGDGVTRWLDPMTRDLYLAWLEGHASADVAFTQQALVIADGTAQDLAREVAALRKKVEHLTPYVEAFRREEARADKAERAADDVPDPYNLRIAALEAAENACDDLRMSPNHKNLPGANACIVAIRALIAKEVADGRQSIEPKNG